MPSTMRRRQCKYLICTVLIVGFLIYIRSPSTGIGSPTAFYSRTATRLTADGFQVSSSLDKIEPVRGSSSTKKLSNEDADSEARSSRLREAESLAKENANKKAPSRESVMGPSDAEGDQKKYKAGVQEIKMSEPKNPNVAAAAPSQNRSLRTKPDAAVKVKTPQEIEEEAAVEDILNDLLKMAPIIIFSKSYCPYSKKAKHFLMDVYKIEPRPYVVELDQIELGSSVQALLAETTKRSTVPNILIRGRSIGGGDDIQALHENGQLEGKIREYGGSQILKFELVDGAESH